MIASSRWLEVAFFVLLFVATIAAQEQSLEEKLYSEISESICPHYILHPKPDCDSPGYHQHPKNCSWFYSCNKGSEERWYTRKYFTCNGGRLFCNIAKQCVFPIDNSYKCDKDTAVKVNQQVINIYGQNVVSIGSLSDKSIGPLIFLVNGVTPINETSVLGSLQNGITSQNISGAVVISVNGSSIDSMIPADKTEDSSQPCNITTADQVTYAQTVSIPQKTIFLTIKFPTFTNNSSTTETENEISIMNKFSYITISNYTLLNILNLTQTSQIIKCKSNAVMCTVYHSCESINGNSTRTILCQNVPIVCENIPMKLRVCGENGFYSFDRNECVRQLCPIKGTKPYVEPISAISPVDITVSTKSPYTTPINMLPTSETTTEAQSVDVVSYTTESLITSQESTTEEQEITTLKTTTIEEEMPESITEIPHSSIIYTSSAPDNMKSTYIEISIPTTKKPTTQNIITESPDDTSCYITLSKCQQYETCTEDKREFLLYYLCEDAFYSCSNNSETKLCQIEELFDPHGMKCIKPACPLITPGTVTTTSTSSTTNIQSSIKDNFTEYYTTSTPRTTDTTTKILSTTESQDGTTIKDGQHSTPYSQITSSVANKTPDSTKHTTDSTESVVYMLNTTIMNIVTDLPSTTVDENSIEIATSTDDLKVTTEPSISEITTSNETSTLGSTVMPQGINTTTINSLQTVSCQFGYENCKTYQTCQTNNASLQNTYLCREAFSICEPLNTKTYICRSSEMYNPQTEKCLSSLCPIKQTNIISIDSLISGVNVSNQISSTDNSITNTPDSTTTHIIEQSSTNSTSTVDVITEITEQGSSNNTLITNIVTTTTTVTCTIFYRYCKNYTICINNEKNQRNMYMCEEVFSQCGKTESKISACKGSDKYNPHMKACVSNHCPLKYTDAIIVHPSSIQGNETSSQTSSASFQITDVESSKNGTISIQEEIGSVDESPDKIVTTVICTFYYSYCKFYTICDKNDTVYLCREAYSECGPSKMKMNACKENENYNPRMKKCITNLCPLEYTDAIVIHSTIIQQGLDHLNSSNTIQIDSNVVSGNISISIEGLTTDGIEASHISANTTTIYCMFSYGYCKLYEICETENAATKNMYLCQEAFSDCGPTKTKISACNDSNMYNPGRKICISRKCPLEYIDAEIVETTIIHEGSISNQNLSSSTQIPAIEESGNISSSNSSLTTIEETINPSIIASVTVTCTFFYKYCKLYDTCDGRGAMKQMYLCLESFSECGPLKEKINACGLKNMYDPNTKACVSKRCPLEHTYAIVVQTTVIKGISTSSHNISFTNHVSGIDLSGNISMSGSSQITGTETSNISTSSIETINCSFFHKYCKVYDTCNEKGLLKDLYMCQESYSECGPTKKKINACKNDDMYDPYMKLCVSNSCPLEYTYALLVQTTLIQGITGYGQTSSTISPTTDNQTSGNYSITTDGQVVSTETAQGQISSIVTCIFSHRYCRPYETCDEKGNLKEVYMCLESFSECGSTKQKINACDGDDMYDPDIKACVSKRCPLVYTYAVIIHTTITQGISTSSQNLSTINNISAIEFSGNNSIPVSGHIIATETSHGSSSSDKMGNCIFFHKYCKFYEICDDKGLMKDLYMCRKSFSECGPTKKKINACRETDMYNPEMKICVSNGCPFQYTFALFVQTTILQGINSSSQNLSTNIGNTVIEIAANTSTSIDGQTTDIDTSYGSISSTVTVTCIFFHKYCKIYETCDDNGTLKEVYMCLESYSECGPTKQKINACEDVMYDPATKACVSKRCPLEYSHAVIIQTTIIQEISSSTQNSSTNTQITGIQESGNISNIFDGEETDTQTSHETSSVTMVNCIFFSKYCKFYEICDNTGITKNLYICRESFSECGPSRKKINACRNDDMYDPAMKVCVSKRCPLEYTYALLVETSIIPEIISSSQNLTTHIQITGSEFSGNISNIIGAQTADKETPQGFVSSTVTCTFIHRYCKHYDTCDEIGMTKDVYMCLESFSECGSTKNKISACRKGHMYDPFKKACVISRCPLQYTYALVVQTTVIQGITSTTMNSSTASHLFGTEVSGNMTTSGSGQETDGETSDGNMSSGGATTCTFSYKYCKPYQTCDNSAATKDVYMCRESYSECGSAENKVNACSKDHMYDPNLKACIAKRCPLEYTYAMIVQTTLIQGFSSSSKNSSSLGQITNITVSKNSSITIGELTTGTEISPDTTSSSIIDIQANVSSESLSGGINTTSISTVSTTTVSCTFFYHYCKQYEACGNNDQNKTNLYLCREAFSECGPSKMKINACNGIERFSLEMKACISNLCPLIYTDAIIIETTVVETDITKDSNSSSEINSITNITTIITEVPDKSNTSFETVGISVSCRSHYHLCKDYNHCMQDNSNHTTYLCKVSFTECEHLSNRINSCHGTDLFAPYNKICYSSLCPDKYYNAIVGGAISDFNLINSNHSFSEINKFPITSIVSEVGGVSITCFLSYSQCRSYEICIDATEQNDRLYLCEEAFSECIKGTIKKMACAPSHLYDPGLKRCISKLCQFTYYNASLLDINSFEVFSLISGFSIDSVYMSHVILGGNITVIELPKLPDGQIQKYVTQQLGTFECSLRYHYCNFLKTCSSTDQEINTLLCQKITSKCSGQISSYKVCPDSYYFNPISKKCVFPSCPYNEESLTIYINRTIHVQITTTNIYSEKITTLSKNISTSTIASNNLATISSDCFLSYKFCKNYSSCLMGGDSREIYMCQEAYEDCPSLKTRTNLCGNSVMYSPNDNKCVSLLCPLMLTNIKTSKNSNQVQILTNITLSEELSSADHPENNTIDKYPNELLPTLPISTKNKTSTLHDNKGLSHSLLVYCQYNFEQCNYIRICDTDNKRPHDKVFCQAMENCYFRNQTISSTSVCGTNESYDIMEKKCSNITEEMRNCPGSGILRELVSAANLFQTENNNIHGQISVNYELQKADASLSCSKFRTRPDIGPAKVHVCSKHVICTTGGFIKVFEMKDVCDNYIQCVLHENEWYITKMRCPTGKNFSYAEDKCIPPKIPAGCQFWSKSYIS